MFSEKVIDDFIKCIGDAHSAEIVGMRAVDRAAIALLLAVHILGGHIGHARIPKSQGALVGFADRATALLADVILIAGLIVHQNNGIRVCRANALVDRKMRGQNAIGTVGIHIIIEGIKRAIEGIHVVNHRGFGIAVARKSEVNIICAKTS